MPLLSAILSAPFATAYPPLLLGALDAIGTVVVTDWPRVVYHRGEILKGLVICWCKIEEEDEQSKELERVRAKIRECVTLLNGVLKCKIDVEAEYQPLIESDNRLEQLLVV